jgi:hypothetical protein
MHRRLEAGEQEQERHGLQLVVAQLVAVLLGLDQGGHETGPRLLPALLEVPPEILQEPENPGQGQQYAEQRNRTKKRLDPPGEFRSVLFGEAQQLADNRHGQGPRPLFQEIHRFPAGEAIEKAITEDGYVAAHGLDAVPAEGLIDQAAQAAVVRVVVREHVVGEHPQYAW